MPTVLITRPSLQGKELCSLLNSAGISTQYQPLIEFQPTETIPDLKQTLYQADIIIAVSQPAVRYFHQQLVKNSLFWPQTSRYLAIGQKTARLLRKLSQQQVDYPSHGDSEHLLSHPSLLNVREQNIVILRGNGGREFLAEQLLQQGAHVKYCESYRRKFIPFEASDKVVQWQKQNVSHVVFTSEEQLRFFVNQITKENRLWMLNLHIFVPSQRIAQVAKEIGFQNTIVVGSANNFDLVAAIQPKVIGILNDNQQHNARKQ
ncbi:uroporphyrinogen-III synthase [Vibrio salinus]|uniref:uroporphyrinogen-III synthase n=1 Tax=Vibrio salinus TaxID=2899784 RepID=UPI001E462E42|nr:uroporphyrinogen-III synthase [Vibrio salinus]MCE0493558.1 uroporphyrinogen-III synthase [Vibrio salinus]